MLPVNTPAKMGLDEARIERAYELLRKWTSGADAPIPGATLLVCRNGQMLPPRFFGKQGPEPDAPPIREDSLFLLASITKPIVYLAAMKLVERGELNLSQRVTDFLPDFAAQHKEETLVLHLFTHTSGLVDVLPENEALRRSHAPLNKFVAAAQATVPLFPAGTAFSYQSMGTLLVAEIVQRITGLTIAEFLQRELFAPLGLQNIALGSRTLDRARLVRVQVPDYQQGTDFGWNSKYWQELGAPWGGMFAAPADFAVICQLLLQQREYNGTRLFGRNTIRLMTSNRLVDQPGLPESVVRAQPWGWGWKLNHRGTSESWGETLGPQVFGHTGATGTIAWMDPESQTSFLLFTSGIYNLNSTRLIHISNLVGGAVIV